MSKPVVSIILPFYNVESYIEKCIESILRQTFTDFELILVNDSSTDSSLKIINSTFSSDRRIKIIDSVNKGANYARRTGLEFAVGKYILFSDSDDLWHINALERMYNIAILKDVDMVACNIMFTPLNKETESYSIYNYNIKNRVLKKSKSKNFILYYPSNIVAKLTKKHCFENVEFDNVPFNQDWNISYKILMNLESFYFLDMNLYFYLSRGNSTSFYNSKNTSIESIIRAKQCYKGILNHYQKHLKYSNYKCELDYIGLKFYYSLLYRSYHNSDKTIRLKVHKMNHINLIDQNISFFNKFLFYEGFTNSLISLCLKYFFFSEINRVLLRLKK